MIRISCDGCGGRCCMDPLTPILLPAEEEIFTGSSVLVRTPFRDMRVLAKGGDGRCVFLDDATRSCKIYGRRPLECRIYPFLLDFDSGVGFKLDTSVCTHLDSLNYDGKAISGLLEAQNWPEDWIKAYLSMDG